MKDPQYSSIRVILVIIIIAAVGFFAYNAGHKNSLDNSGRVIDTSTETVLNGHLGDLTPNVSCYPYGAGTMGGACGHICVTDTGSSWTTCGTYDLNFGCINEHTCTPGVVTNPLGSYGYIFKSVDGSKISTGTSVSQ